MDRNSHQAAGRRAILLRLGLGALAPAVVAVGGAQAQTPAEQASRSLNRQLEEDRTADRARDAAGEGEAAPGAALPRVQQLDEQRRSLQPDLVRPNQAVPLTGGERAATGGGQNPQR
jgi:hypothetical protein